jgi:hypothetical protein
MAVDIKWIIVQLDTKPQAEGLQDVVSIVHYRRNAIDGDYSAESYGTMTCETPSSTDFTAYPNLTQLQVESWLDNGLDVASIDTGLISSIDAKKNPPIVTLPLPWAE